MTDFKTKMHEIQFRLGLCLRPRWGAYNAPQTPLLDLDAASRRGRGWAGEEEGKREGRDGEVEGRERERPQVTVEPVPLETCYATGGEPGFFGLRCIA